MTNDSPSTFFLICKRELIRAHDLVFVRIQYNHAYRAEPSMRAPCPYCLEAAVIDDETDHPERWHGFGTGRLLRSLCSKVTLCLRRRSQCSGLTPGESQQEAGSA